MNTPYKSVLEKARHEAYAIISNSPLVAFTWKNAPGWPIEFVTHNIEKEFGYTPEELLNGGTSYDRIIFPDDLARVVEKMETFREDNTRSSVSHAPYRIVTKSGDIRWVDDREVMQSGKSKLFYEERQNGPDGRPKWVLSSGRSKR